MGGAEEKAFPTEKATEIIKVFCSKFWHF